MDFSKVVLCSIILMVNVVYINGRIETLYKEETECYKTCLETNPNSPHLDACRKGCDLRLLKKTPEQCKPSCTEEYSKTFDLISSCIAGCDSSAPKISQVLLPFIELKPLIDTIQKSAENEDNHPKSIILVRLRQRPPIQLPSMERIFSEDPFRMFNSILQQIREKTNEFEKNLQPLSPPVENSIGNPVFRLIQSIPVNPKPINQNEKESSSSESSEEDRNPLFEEIKHIVQHPREQQQVIKQRIEPINMRLQQFFNDVKTEWNDLIRKQPKLPVWIFICILLTSSAVLWYMAMSMCRHSPSRDHLSIRSQELIFHPYESSDVFSAEKEKIQPDELYEVVQPLPIKVKLSNI